MKVNHLLNSKRIKSHSLAHIMLSRGTNATLVPKAAPDSNPGPPARNSCPNRHFKGNFHAERDNILSKIPSNHHFPTKKVHTRNTCEKLNLCPEHNKISRFQHQIHLKPTLYTLKRIRIQFGGQKELLTLFNAFLMLFPAF